MTRFFAGAGAGLAAAGAACFESGAGAGLAAGAGFADGMVAGALWGAIASDASSTRAASIEVGSEERRLAPSIESAPHRGEGGAGRTSGRRERNSFPSRGRAQGTRAAGPGEGAGAAVVDAPAAPAAPAAVIVAA